MPHPLQLFVTCEHGGNRVPAPYRQLFAGREQVLETHRGYDIGILPLARAVAARFKAPLIFSEVTRLLVDLNRSPGSRTLFSEFTRHLPRRERETILQRYHQPYRQTVEDIVGEMIAAGRKVLHLSVHSFTPVLGDSLRHADIGLLYDPARPAEKQWCLQWQQALALLHPTLRVRRNYPYRGSADALVTALRGRFPAAAYLGIELEVNQRLPLGNRSLWETLQDQLLTSLQTVFHRRD